MTVRPYNPLDKENLGISVANAMLGQSVHELSKLQAFAGAGIYAVYYTGDFPCYEDLAKVNRGDRFDCPIYVGKAVPSGARKGNVNAAVASRALYQRLKKHAESVSSATNLDVADFHCRFLIVDDIWIPLGESLLIAKFAPVWNRCVDGFGNNDPGSGRYNQERSKWDVLHPGRTWAERCAARNEPLQVIEEEVRTYLANHL